MNISVTQPLRKKMKEMIPNLPSDWAETVGEKMGIKADVVRSYVRGDRGKRDKGKVILVFKLMKEIEKEIINEIDQLIQ